MKYHVRPNLNPFRLFVQIGFFVMKKKTAHLIDALILIGHFPCIISLLSPRHTPVQRVALNTRVCLPNTIKPQRKTISFTALSVVLS